MSQIQIITNHLHLDAATQVHKPPDGADRARASAVLLNRAGGLRETVTAWPLAVTARAAEQCEPRSLGSVT